jgi:hypothetical protein
MSVTYNSIANSSVSGAPVRCAEGHENLIYNVINYKRNTNGAFKIILWCRHLK